MKKTFLLLLLLPCFLFSQNKYFQPIGMIDFPIQKNYFPGYSVNFGCLFGTEKFVQIGLIVGFREHQSQIYPISYTESSFNFSFFWNIPIKRFIIMPMATYANESYQDLSLKVGYSTNKSKRVYIHMLASNKMGIGVGTTFKLKYQ